MKIEDLTEEQKKYLASVRPGFMAVYLTQWMDHNFHEWMEKKWRSRINVPDNIAILLKTKEA